jgi:hypothetical protein
VGPANPAVDEVLIEILAASLVDAKTKTIV